MTFVDFFKEAVGCEPYPWQQRVAADGLPDLLSIPTGLGKTEGVALGWAYRLLVEPRSDTPRHLVFCLPMRVLVSQTAERLRAAFAKLGKAGCGSVAVHELMGGTKREDQDGWLRNPEAPWVLVGTQDQLLSRALNRGYCASQYDWPVHFGILNNDCHWVLDEVQLMGPGVWTSAQLDWMRRCRFPTIGKCATTWMSATLGGNSLETYDRKKSKVQLRKETIDTADERQPSVKQRLDAHKAVEVFAAAPVQGTKKRGRAKAGRGTPAPAPDEIARRVASAHTSGTLSLVVCNTVAAAQAVYAALPDGMPRVLLTSRFRGEDRAVGEGRLLDFERRRRTHSPVVPDDPGLVCVATQVVEAGLDISARILWSEVAPWGAVVQRLGRLNRDGMDNGGARAVFIEPQCGENGEGEDRIGPYARDAIDASRGLIDELCGASQTKSANDALDHVARVRAKDVARELQLPECPFPRATDVHGLFATAKDLHGGFTDVSAFVRSEDPQGDVHVFWRDLASRDWDSQLTGPLPCRDEQCAVTVAALRNLLARRKAAGDAAYIWDADQKRWLALRPDAARPGMVVMLSGRLGGYRQDIGWTGDPADHLGKLQPPGPGGKSRDDDARSFRSKGVVALQDHLGDAEKEARKLVKALGLDADPVAKAIVEAARHHDLGKLHPQWQNALPVGGRSGGPFAKGVEGKSFRPGMRHEAATALALVAKRQGGTQISMLAIYLAAAHHGKVRTCFSSRTPGGDDVCGVPRAVGHLPAIGGPGTPAMPLDFGCAQDGVEGRFVGVWFEPQTPGWTGIVSDLLGAAHEGRRWDTGSVPDDEPRNLGPFQLAYLEALVRIADWRASDQPSRVLP